MTKTLEQYLSLKYPLELREDPGAGWFARHPDLEGCMTVGDSAAEAVANLDDARDLWIRTRFERGFAIPEPQDVDEEPSGKYLLRMPAWLHGKLMRAADRQHISLNRLLNSVLAEYVGGAQYLSDLEKIVEKLKGLAAALERQERVVVLRDDRAAQIAHEFSTRKAWQRKLHANIIMEQVGLPAPRSSGKLVV